MRKQKKHFFSKHLYLKTYLLGIAFSFLFVPFFAYAATTYSQDLFGLFAYLRAIIDDIVLWLFTTGAVVLFMFFLLRRMYEQAKGQSDKISETNKYIVWGLIALTLMFTFYAVAGLIAVTFGIQLGIPQFFGGENALGNGAGNVNRSYSIIR